MGVAIINHYQNTSEGGPFKNIEHVYAAFSGGTTATVTLKASHAYALVAVIFGNSNSTNVYYLPFAGGMRLIENNDTYVNIGYGREIGPGNSGYSDAYDRNTTTVLIKMNNTKILTSGAASAKVYCTLTGFAFD